IGITGNFDKEGGNYAVLPSLYFQPRGIATREREFVQVRSFESMAPRIGYDIHPVWCKIIPEAQAMHLPFQIMNSNPYPVRALLGFGINHRMWPGSDFMRESLKKLDFMIAVDLFMTDTTKLADLVLPACSSFEKNDLKIWPSGYAFWTKPAIKPLGESRSDFDIIVALAKKLGLDDNLLFSGQEACIDWVFEPAGCKISDIKNIPEGHVISNGGKPCYEKYKQKGFPTPSGKMEFTSSLLKDEGYDPLPKYFEPRHSPVSSPEIKDNFPLVFTTGARLPMFFHSRTFRLPWTRRLRPEPMADINPKDAMERDISQGDKIVLSTPRSSIMIKANLTEKVSPGVVNMLHGYPDADVNQLIEPDYRDPISGFPGFKSMLCNIEKAPVK
ncbi:MAG: molybdopterin-dependent oxidoreductase, partial [Deltaproteobacteria bacterium]|nr:molybdopterin-dependent oxidoreductase [Deltaproteobacteria bacterium]